MQLAAHVSHRDARPILERLGLLNSVREAIDAPGIAVRKGCSNTVKQHIMGCLRAEGWASPVKIDPSLGPDLNLWHREGVVLHVQTGNIARAFYDLMKMQSLFEQGRVECGVLVMPTREAARRIGGNLANFSRVEEELEALFYTQIGVPVLLVAFD